MLCPFEKNLCKDSWVAVDGWGKCEQGFRRMAARNKPARIRSLVYGIGKGKVLIEGLSVSGLDQTEHDRFFGRFLTIAD